MPKFNLLTNQTTKTKPNAKQTLYTIGLQVLKTCNAPTQISFLGFSYNITQKLHDEINKLTEETAQQALNAIKQEIEKYGN